MKYNKTKISEKIYIKWYNASLNHIKLQKKNIKVKLNVFMNIKTNWQNMNDLFVVWNW